MTRLYQLPCPHPTRDIVAGVFRERNVARLCDRCLILLYEETIGRPPGLHTLEESREEFKLDLGRARAIAAVLGVSSPSPRDLELLPVAAALVARCDDIRTLHGVMRPPWGLGDVFLERGTTGDKELDRLCTLALLTGHADAADLDAAVDRVTEEASA